MLFLHSNTHQNLWNSLIYVNLAWIWPLFHEIRRSVGGENHRYRPPTHVRAPAEPSARVVPSIPRVVRSGSTQEQKRKRREKQTRNPNFESKILPRISRNKNEISAIDVWPQDQEDPRKRSRKDWVYAANLGCYPVKREDLTNLKNLFHKTKEMTSTKRLMPGPSTHI